MLQAGHLSAILAFEITMTRTERSRFCSPFSLTLTKSHLGAGGQVVMVGISVVTDPAVSRPGKNVFSHALALLAALTCAICLLLHSI